MHIAMPDDSELLDREIPALDLRRSMAEKVSFGYSYADVSARLIRQWHFPLPIVDALQHQTAPFENDVYEPLAGVIHLATWRARCQEAGLSEKVMAVTFPGPVGEALGLDIDMVLQQDSFDWFVNRSANAVV
jgi:HD-like signal output (HDOD) protein